MTKNISVSQKHKKHDKNNMKHKNNAITKNQQEAEMLVGFQG